MRGDLVFCDFQHEIHGRFFSPIGCFLVHGNLLLDLFPPMARDTGGNCDLHKQFFWFLKIFVPLAPDPLIKWLDALSLRLAPDLFRRAIR